MYKGKAIYNPSGKAAEYSKWACNFYIGCSNNCTYCYCKKGVLANQLGSNKPKLKGCFKDCIHAMEVFERELVKNLNELRKHSLFFSFTTDPMLPETADLTMEAVQLCQELNVPVKILTKSVDYLFMLANYKEEYSWDVNKIAIGFTLTDYDELEPNASKNEDRIYAMSVLKSEGYKTFASIEPIINFWSAKKMIIQTLEYCDLYKIGLMSGEKYDQFKSQLFIEWLNTLNKPKIYLKESLQKLSKYTNAELDDYFVDKDYNMFL